MFQHGEAGLIPGARLQGELCVCTELPVGSGGLWEDGGRVVATSPDRRLLRWFTWVTLSRVGLEETGCSQEDDLCDETGRPRMRRVRIREQPAVPERSQVWATVDSWGKGSRRRQRPAGMWEEGEFWTYSVGLFFRNAESLSPSEPGYLSNWKCSWLQVAISRKLHFNSCQEL